MKKTKAPVGEVECPLKGCAEVVPVFKYAGSDDAAKRRFAGRLYAICPTHGRIENSEYLLCHAKLNGPGELPAESPAESKPQPTPPTTTPTSPRLENQKKQTPPWWQKWRPLIQ